MSATAPLAQTLTMTRLLRAPRARVFAAFASADMLGAWLCPVGFTCRAEADFRVGGRYVLTMRAPDGGESRVAGVYREIRAPERVVFTWAWDALGDNDYAGIETEVTVSLTARGDTTALEMIHRGLPDDAACRRHEWGWSGAFDNLANAVAAKEGGNE